jgi:hypothetical protein
MKIGTSRTRLSLVVIVGICGWGCQITGASSDAAVSSGGTTGSGGATGSGGSPGAGGTGTAVACTRVTTPTPTSGPTGGPCDIYAADGGPCVAAHSTVRALYASYSGPLYQVKKADGTTMDIAPIAPGGFASSADQDTFCGVDACTISIIYDQSGYGNDLTKAPAGGEKATPDNEANAKAVSATFGGQAVYGVHIAPGIGYRNNTPCGTATGDNPETEYMIVAGSVFNSACCFDYGNMETTSRDDSEGTMEAVYFGNCTVWNKGAGSGPWVMGDLENGLWAGNSSPYANNMPLTFSYITGMVKGDAAGKNHWTIKSGNAQSGNLITPFDGTRPSTRYNPMRKEGAVGLGTGGDNSDGATGNFFEGVMTNAYSSDAADDAVQANIVSVYGQ